MLQQTVQNCQCVTWPFCPIYIIKQADNIEKSLFYIKFKFYFNSRQKSLYVASVIKYAYNIDLHINIL